MSADRFAGRVAVVTGSGRGIGRAVALELGQAGARLGLVARSRDQLDETAQLVREIGATCAVEVVDLLDHAALDAALTRLESNLGPVDILINNAATVEPAGPFEATSLDQWADALRLNVLAPVQLTQRVLPEMIRRGWGRVANVSSGIVSHPEAMVGLNAYAAAKAALEAHTKNLAAELRGTGVTANIYRPGSVDTAMQAWFRSQTPEAIGSSLHERFRTSFETGALITPETSARSLAQRLFGDGTGEVWDVNDPIE